MPTAFHKMLPAGRPGERFRNRYHQHRKSKQRGLGGMVVRFILAAVCLVIGFVLVFIPGPAVVFFLIAGALLATDWLPIARFLDWGEVHARRLGKHAKKIWARMAMPARVALVTVAVLGGAAMSLGVYQLMR
jgi:hypothetical protein